MSDLEKLIHICNELSFLSGRVSMDNSVYEKRKQLIESLHRDKLLIKARNEYQQLEARNKELETVIREAADYLNTNELTSIGHKSILHKKFEAINNE